MQTAMRKLDTLWASLSRDDPDFGRAVQVRTLAALLALFSMMLPWVRLDGYTESMTGAELLAFAFTSPERGAMFRTVPLGAIALLLVPLAAAATAVYSFVKNVQGEHPIAANLALIFLPIVMLFFGQALTASDQPRLVWVSIPRPGIILMIACNAGLLAHSLHVESQGRR